MGLLSRLVTLPVSGPIGLVQYLARTIAEEAEREMLDEEAVRGDLLNLQEQMDAGELPASEFDQREDLLLRRLDQIRSIKERRAGGG